MLILITNYYNPDFFLHNSSHSLNLVFFSFFQSTKRESEIKEIASQ